MKKLLYLLGVLALGATLQAQKGVAFTPSANNADVVGYRVQLISSTNTVAVDKNIGKPAVDPTTGEIIYLDPTMFSGLAPGTYYAVAVAYNDVGEAASLPSENFSIAEPPPPTPAPAPPGTPVIIPNDPPSTTNPDEVVLYAITGVPSGRWSAVSDPTAAHGVAMYNPDGQPKVNPFVQSSNYVEWTFSARAGVPYHVWLRLRADADSWVNDSVYIQFSSAKDATGQPVAPIGTDIAQGVVLEEGNGAGEQGWGWNDSDYGGMAAHVYLADGPQTIRVYQREDGIRIDQIVISAGTFLVTRPGLTKNDTTIR